MPITFINKGSGEHNSHSDVDGIGACVASIPRDTWMRIASIEEFDWMQETNDGIVEFVKLNPQYDDRHRAKFTVMPDTVINRDGSVFSLSQMKFLKKSISKGVTAV